MSMIRKNFICIRKIGHRGIHVYGAVCSNLVDACDSIRIFSYSTYFGNLPKEVIKKGQKSLLYIIDEHTDICYDYGKQSKSHKCTFDIDKEMEEYEKKEGVLDAN